MSLFSKTIYGMLFFLWGVAALQGQNQLDEQGRKTGPWKVNYPNSKTLYEAKFHEGRPVGEMIRYYESGAIRARMMFDSLEDRSFAKLYYKNGKQAAEGWYENKVKDSVWNYFSEFDGTVRIREPYWNGKLHGMVRSYYPSGQVSEEVSWLQNKKDGAWRQFYTDGSLRLESWYRDDMLHGSYELFYADNTRMPALIRQHYSALGRRERIREHGARLLDYLPFDVATPRVLTVQFASYL